MGLSDRMWNITSQMKAQMELAISQSLEQGTSAQRLSQDIRKCLVESDMMYRRYYVTKHLADGSKRKVAEWRRKVTDADGKIHFVKEEMLDSSDVKQKGRSSSIVEAVPAFLLELHLLFGEADTAYCRFTLCVWHDYFLIRTIRSSQIP